MKTVTHEILPAFQKACVLLFAGAGARCGTRRGTSLARTALPLEGMRPGFSALLLTAMAVGLLPGCATYQPKPLSAEKSVADFTARTLRDTALRPFLETNLHRRLDAWPPAAWDFSTLTLAAFYYHPDLDVARAQWHTARAGRVTAGQRPNPTVSLQPTYDTTTPPAWILGVTVDVPLETAGKRGYRRAEAAHRSEAARWHIAEVAWQVRSRLRRSLLEWHTAQQSCSLLRQQESNQVVSVRLLEGQFNAGAVATFTVTEARVALHQAELAVHDAEQRRAVARVEVASALGVPVTALEGLVFDLRELQSLPAEPAGADAHRQALLNRADLRAALAEYAATDAALRLQVAKQYPDVHLNPGYQLDQTDNKWTLGLTVELPVLSQNQGPIAEAEARRVETGLRFNALQARALSEIDLALAAYRAAREKAGAAAQLLDDARRLENAARELLRAGEVPLLDLVQRQVESGAAEVAGLSAAASAQQALGAIEDALQSPLPPLSAIEQDLRVPTRSSKP